MKIDLAVAPARPHLAADQDAVLAVIEQYARAIHAGDTRGIREAFHPTATLIGWDEGSMRHATLEQWFAFVESIPSPESAGQAHDAVVEWIEVCGTVAIARVRESYRAFRYVDYLSLIKTPDGWRIAHKSYHQEKI